MNKSSEIIEEFVNKIPSLYYEGHWDDGSLEVHSVFDNFPNASHPHYLVVRKLDQSGNDGWEVWVAKINEESHGDKWRALKVIVGSDKFRYAPGNMKFSLENHDLLWNFVNEANAIDFVMRRLVANILLSRALSMKSISEERAEAKRLSREQDVKDLESGVKTREQLRQERKLFDFSRLRVHFDLVKF